MLRLRVRNSVLGRLRMLRWLAVCGAPLKASSVDKTRLVTFSGGCWPVLGSLRAQSRKNRLSPPREAMTRQTRRPSASPCPALLFLQPGSGK